MLYEFEGRSMALLSVQIDHHADSHPCPDQQFEYDNILPQVQIQGAGVNSNLMSQMESTFMLFYAGIKEYRMLI